MRAFPFVAVLLLAVSFSYAENYTKEYLIGGWMKVNRTVSVSESAACGVSGVTGACSATGATAPVDLGTRAGYLTEVTMDIGNSGTLEREGVLLTESLAYVPDGVRMEFLPKPDSMDGRSASWALGSLKPGGSAVISYSFNAGTDPGDIGRIPEPELSSAPVNAVLSAPAKAVVGQKVALFLRTDSGQPIPGATVKVSFPDGSRQYLTTNGRGAASFVASGEGAYSYSVEDYRVAKLSGTAAEPEELPPAAASAIPDSGLAGAVTGLLPALAAIFAFAVLALVAYNFLSSKKEEEYVPATQPSSQTLNQSSLYSQNYSFGPKQEAAAQSHVDEVARQLLESRRKQMESESGPRPDAVQEPQSPAQWTESATTEDEADVRLVELEHQARSEGESASQEKEIEKAIAELEAIRQKLKERKETMESVSGPAEEPEEEAGEGAGEEEEAAEPDEPQGPSAPAPAKSAKAKPAPAQEKKAPSRVMPPKKKLKLGTHGIKRK